MIRTKLLDGNIPVRTANSHDKLVLVHSRYAMSSSPRKIMFNGSHNLTEDGNYTNDELLVKLFNDDVYDDMLDTHYNRIWSDGTSVT